MDGKILICAGGGGSSARKPGASSLTTKRLQWHDFRDHMIAAPLKLFRMRRRHAAAFNFRDHMIAAPLKRSDGKPLHRCGGISAII